MGATAPRGRPPTRTTTCLRSTTTSPLPARTSGSTDGQRARENARSHGDSGSCRNSRRDRRSCTVGGGPTSRRCGGSPRNHRLTARLLAPCRDGHSCPSSWDARLARSPIPAVERGHVAGNGVGSHSSCLSLVWWAQAVWWGTPNGTSPRTTRTGSVDLRRTPSDTLPSSMLRTAPWPRDPTTMRSAPHSST